MRVTPQDAAVLWQKYSSIPTSFAIGTATVESDFDPLCTTIERGGASPTSKGLYQVNDGEAASVGEPGADLLDAETCTRVYANLAAGRLETLRGWGAREPDIWAYLGLAHNQGMGAAQTTIQNYGADWDAYKARNPGARINRYGDYCLTGGPRYHEVGGTDPSDAVNDLLGGLFGIWPDASDSPSLDGAVDSSFPVAALALGAAAILLMVVS